MHFRLRFLYGVFLSACAMAHKFELGNQKANFTGQSPHAKGVLGPWRVVRLGSGQHGSEILKIPVDFADRLAQRFIFHQQPSRTANSPCHDFT